MITYAFGNDIASEEGFVGTIDSINDESGALTALQWESTYPNQHHVPAYPVQEGYVNRSLDMSWVPPPPGTWIPNYPNSFPPPVPLNTGFHTTDQTDYGSPEPGDNLSGFFFIS